MRDYHTQMEAAKKGILTPQMEIVAKKENMSADELIRRVAAGTIAIPANINHPSLSAEGIGDGLRTKINVNLGISGDCVDYTQEMNKVKMAVEMGAESIMDLSNYGKTRDFRKALVDYSPAMIGTVPMYDAIGYLEKDLRDITVSDFLKVIEAHAKEGVDFMTIHAGINRRAVEAFRREGRKMNIVSRGGSLLFAWMEMNGKENPMFEYYDDVLDILQEYDVTISLSGVSTPLMGNARLLDELVSNLIENAIRYNKPGGKVFVWVLPQGGRPCLRVSDTGIGIPEEAQGKVFERFYRVDKGRSRDMGGTGLGLAIVKHAATYHGADIRLDSRVGEGTTITVTFPKQ